MIGWVTRHMLPQGPPPPCKQALILTYYIIPQMNYVLYGNRGVIDVQLRPNLRCHLNWKIKRARGLKIVSEEVISLRT